MKRIFTHLFVAVLLMLSSTSWAQFENGKVYRIVCSGTTSVSLGASALTDVAAVSTSETDKSQQWYVTVSGSNYTFRNLGNGRYLLGNNGTSGEWGLTESSNNFTVSEVSGNYCIRGASDTNGYAYMHKDAGNNIVSWESNAGNSQWTMHEVSYSTSELDAVWAKVESLVVPSETVSGYQTKLEAIFTDKACTQLNSTYKAKTVDQIKADANYLALPATLQDMVLKVYGGDWTEYTVAPADRPNGNNNTNHSLWSVSDTWENDYAKRFRVQMYEPYSIEGEITSYLRFNAHCNMDNPTGIYADGGEPIYIMVEGTIADGAELWVAHQTGHGATGYYSNVIYTRLHEGLNVVPYFNDGSQLWINYLVHTYNASGETIEEKFPHKLSDYKPLKIHIEGGRINGYYNAIGDFRATDSGTENLWGEVDNDEDWNYYKARVALSTDFALLGHRQTPLFPFGTYESGKNAFCTYNEGGGLEYALAYHLDHIEVPTTPNCYSGSGNTFGTFAGSYSGMNLDASNGKINIMIEAWDRIMYSELATMGLVSTSTMDKMNSLYPRWTSEGTAAEIYNYGEATVNGETKTYKEFCQGLDYSEYFNHHGAGVGAPSGYMSGGWRVCNYHYNTMGSVIGKIAAEAGPTWGPAHEIGHQHQGVFNLNGQTEVTNNFFSNVAVWYMGMGTSRVNGSEGSLASVLGAFNTDGNDLYTNNIWAITHLYYRLWLYYHLAGNNTQFWPRLFELCRQVPLVNGGQISGETSLLRFYQHACDAAGEDLTEFFRAHGYFEIMDNRFVGDYSNATYNITQEQIDAAIKSVKDKGYPVNYAALLINDATSETTVKHDGATKRSLWDGSATADLGSVNDFIDGEIESLTNYTATVSADGTVSMSGGEGGIGFLVLNEDGELVSFSNKTEFALNDEAAYLLATGKAEIVAVDTDSETAEAEVDLSAIQREMLEALIEKVDAMPIDDGTYTHVGFYTKACAAELLATLESAKTVLASGTGFAAAYELLYTAKEKLVNSPNLSYVPFDPSLTYIITNYAYKDKTMYLSSGVHSNTGIDKSLNTSKWQFKTTGTDGVYNLYNVSGKYLAAASKSTLVASVSDQASAAKYSLIQDSPVGTWAISVSPAAEFATLHDNSYGNVVGWEAGASASKWYLTAIEGSTNSQATPDRDELQALIAKTEILVNEVAIVELSDGDTPVALQTTNANGDFYVRTNATNTGGSNEGPIANLVDGNLGNYFHTQYANSAKSDDNLDHYIEVSMGSGALSAFKFSYTTRAGVANDFPQTIKVYGSNTENKTGDESGYVLLATISSGLSSSSTQTTYTYPSVIDAGIAYKYLRFMVPTTNTNRVANYGAQHNYWHMAEFDILPVNTTATLRDGFTSISNETVVAAYHAMKEASAWLANPSLTSEQLTTAKTALQSAYETLVEEYNGVSDVKKEELQKLINETKTLLNTVGRITTAETEELALQVSSPSSAYYLSTNSQENAVNRNISKLIDGITNDANVYFHTNWQSSVGADHHLLLDMGDGNSLGEFTFKYTTRNNNAGIDAPRTIVVEGSNDNSGFTQIVELTGLPTGQHQTYESAVLGDNATKYRYIRFRVTSGAGNVGGYAYFAMSEFDVTAIGSTDVTINEEYKAKVAEDLFIATNSKVLDSEVFMDNTTSIELLDAQIATLQTAKAALEEAMNNTAALKENLKKLIDDTQALYDKMATDEGTVNEYYRASALTDANLSEAMAEIGDAQTVYDNSSATVEEINTAFDELNVKYGVLNGIEALNVADRSSLQTLITEMEDLLELTTVDGAVETGNVALQVDSKTSPYYIWTYPRATDDNGLGALIDEIDGVANTGTFAGTYWQPDSKITEAYSHYVEIDLGINTVLEDFAIDYTTRYSGAADSRPTGLKFYGSNDKEDYTELFSVTEGLPADANTKWEMSEPYKLEKNYRYIRVAVTSSHERHCFNMSDFNLYANSVTTVNEFYSTSDIFDCLPAVLRGYRDAKDAVAVYLTQDEYDVAKTALQAHIDALQAIVDGNVTDKKDLETLVDETEPLVTEAATISTIEEEITMQCTDANAPYYLYCNAEGKDNGGADALGVSALVGENKDNMSHLHTAYKGNTDDNLDHYLRLDMGEEKALMSFKFSYTGRENNNNNAPVEMVIEGSNDLENFEAITTLTELPTTAATVTYATDEALTNGKAYRYVRFMVTKTNNNAMYNDHPFFVLSKFSVTACKTVEVNANPNMPLNTLVTAHNEAVEAKAMVAETEHYVTQAAYDTAIAELQAAKDALDAAIALKNIPVKLTTDANNPVLYKIKIKSNENVFTYDGQSGDASKNPILSVDALGNKYQAWYFMQGNNEDSNDDILILPYYHEGALNTTHKLGYPNINGSTKPAVSETGASSYNWYITFTEDKTTEGWWNLQPQGGTSDNTYVNQQGGSGSTVLSFWKNASNPNDNGSQFQFILDETDYSLPDAYYALYNQYVACGGKVASGEVIGTYTVESATAYNDAYNNAAVLLEAKNSTDDEYENARTALDAAYDALEYNGGLCKIRSAYTGDGGYSSNKLAYVDAENKPHFEAADDEDLSKYVWEFVPVQGGYHLKNLHTQSYVTAAPWGGQVVLGSEDAPKLVTVDFLDNENSIVRLNVAGGKPLHAQKNGSTLVGWNGDLNSASAWYIEEVENVEENIKHIVSLGADESTAKAYSTLYLAYNAQIPEGVTASIVTGINEIGQLEMTPVEGGILPANTAVVLSGANAGAVEFKYTAEVPEFDTSNNILKGTSCNKLVECGDNYNVYMLGMKNNRVAFYWTYENRGADGNYVYINANEEIVESTAAGAHKNHNKGGYVKCNANKAYLLDEENPAQAAAAMYSFFFGGNTTDLDEVEGENGEVKTIYDLQGRKLVKITSPGIYIVDGKKVYVTEIEE